MGKDFHPALILMATISIFMMSFVLMHSANRNFEAAERDAAQLTTRKEQVHD